MSAQKTQGDQEEQVSARWDEVSRAIRSRNSESLRHLAENTGGETERMILMLLADFIDAERPAVNSATQPASEHKKAQKGAA